ncbi:MAG: hypothetical protein ACREGG_01695 [Candidatus Saccharimonadales bacterium]
MESYSVSHRHKFGRRKKIIFALIPILIAIGVIVLLIHTLNAPAEGTVSQTPPSQAQKTDPYAQSGNYNSKYLTFQYPAHFKLTPTKLTGATLETVEYTSTDQSERHIDVAIFNGNVSSDSGVSYRRQHPELYKETDSRLWTEFSRIDGTEDTFFLQHNDLEATVSATAPFANLNGEALFVVSSLQWK